MALSERVQGDKKLRLRVNQVLTPLQKSQHPSIIDLLKALAKHPGAAVVQDGRNVLSNAVYSQVEAKEPWCVDAQPVVDIGVLNPEQTEVVLGSPLPHLGKVVDEICFIKSVTTDQFNHAPAQIFFNTGFSQPGRPSLGSWALYGLGSETQNLPSFVVMSTGAGLSGGSALWSSGFLPTSYTGVQFRNGKEPILTSMTPTVFCWR